MENASLVVVGSGIKFISHLTVEAQAYIEKANKVLFLVNEPAMKEWIIKKNSNAESLEYLYHQFEVRLHAYRAITQYILKILREKRHVCVVLYGHPSVFAQPGLEAVQQAKKEGYYAKILPGISAQYPGLEPLIMKIKLKDLPQSNTLDTFTLYIPPVRHTEYDKNMLAALEINIANLV